MGKKAVSSTLKTGLRSGLGFVSGGLSEVARAAPKKTFLGKTARLGDTAIDALTGNQPEDNTLMGDFSISPEEIARSRQLIVDNGNANSGAFLKEGTEQDALRKQRRAEMATLLTGVADTQFRRAIPGLAEDANAGGVYTGTGFSDSLARERAMNTEDVQNRLAQQGLSDLDAELGFRTSALGQRTGANDAATSRQFSLEDFIRSANVAKATGQALQPKSDGKAGVGSTLSGVGALAPLLGLFMGGPAGAAAGGAAGSLLGPKKIRTAGLD